MLARLYATMLLTLTSTTTLQQCSIQSTYDTLYGLPKHCSISPTYDSLATRSTLPWLIQKRDIDLPTSTNINYLQRTSSCTSTTRPTSATSNNPPSVPSYDSTNISYSQQSSSFTNLRLDQRQLPASNVQLHTSTTRPTSVTRNNRLASSLRPRPYQLPTPTI